MERIRNHWVIWLAFVTVAVVIAISWRMSVHWFNEPQTHEAFGSVFAFADVVILGITLAFLIIGFASQERYTRQQTSRADQRDFETSFYSKVSLWSEMTNNLSYRVSNQAPWSFQGKEVFSRLIPILMVLVKDIELDSKNIVRTRYDKFYKDTDYALQSYFTVLTNIIRDVFRTKALRDEDKVRAIKFLRAQLTQHEMIHIFYRWEPLKTHPCFGIQDAKLG